MPAALDSLGNAVDGDNLGDHAVVFTVFFIAIMCFLLSLQLQAALTGAISQGLNTAMINVAATVEHDLGDALFQSLCCDLLADLQLRPRRCRRNR